MDGILNSFTSKLGCRSNGKLAEVSFDSRNIYGSTSTLLSLNAASNTNANDKETSKGLCQLLFKDGLDPAGGVICLLPSFDLHPNEEDDEHDANDTAGTSTSPHTQSDLQASSSNPRAEVTIPAMEASVFLIPEDMDSNNPNSNNGNRSLQTNTAAAVTSANASATLLEQTASQNLSNVTAWTRSSIRAAPSSMLQNIAFTFKSLLDSRVRAWTLLLLRHSLSSGDQESRGRLLSLLAASGSIELTTVQTKFVALKLPVEEGVKGKDEEQAKAGNKDEKKKFSTDNCDIVLPVMMEVVVDVSLQSQTITVILRAPGTIAADFHDKSPLLTNVEMKIDTDTLVSSMVEQARIVVFKVVARAASQTPPQTIGLSTLESRPTPSFYKCPKVSIPDIGTNSSLSSFGTSLNISKTMNHNSNYLSSNKTVSTSINISNPVMNEQKSIMKASESSSRFLSILNSGNDNHTRHRSASISNHPSPNSTGNSNIAKSGSILGMKKKQRSVTWNHTVETSKSNDNNKTVFPDIKRRKLGESFNVPLKRSSKSFGKPDANTFKCVRNATFAEFGTLDSGNGRMPQVFKGNQSNIIGLSTRMKNSMTYNNLSSTAKSTSNMNATFSNILRQPQGTPSNVSQSSKPMANITEN